MITHFKRSLGAALMLLLSLTGCKKDTKEPEKKSECEPVAPVGNLIYSASDDVYTFKTSGGGTIKIDLDGSISIGHKDYPGFKIEFWGDTSRDGREVTSGNHENLNGKHVKDRIGTRRTIIFPDGAKITMVAEGNVGPLISVSIYDGAESHRINAVCGSLAHSSTTASEAKQLDDDEADGEAGTFEFTETGLLFVNVYTENVVGDKAEDRRPIGELNRNNPNQVNDFYDDERLGHT